MCVRHIAAYTSLMALPFHVMLAQLNLSIIIWIDTFSSWRWCVRCIYRCFCFAYFFFKFRISLYYYYPRESDAVAHITSPYLTNGTRWNNGCHVCECIYVVEYSLRSTYHISLYTYLPQQPQSHVARKMIRIKIYETKLYALLLYFHFITFHSIPFDIFTLIFAFAFI